MRLVQLGIFTLPTKQFLSIPITISLIDGRFSSLHETQRDATYNKCLIVPSMNVGNAILASHTSINLCFSINGTAQSTIEAGSLETSIAF
jgi:hypothetical protein